MAAQERVRHLLDAAVAVTSGLDLASVLRRVVEAACALVDARYGALGVLDDEGGLREFVHVGVDDATVAAIGHLPEGHGILGLLIREPHPLRLDDLRAHEAAYGFPDHHPPMRTFLGAPIRVRGEVFGNLYLTEKASGEPFAAEDEELLIGLAAVAGAAIDNAQLYDITRKRQQSLDALREITEQVLGTGERDEVLAHVARHARELVGADVAAIVMPAGADTFQLAVVEGDGADDLRGLVFPRDTAIPGEVMQRRQPLVVDDLAGDPRTADPMVRLGHFGPTLFIPIAQREKVLGTLVVANRRGRARFHDADRRLVETFASQASVALEYGRAQAQLQRLALVEERERIGRDLHDSVIQRLFATGLEFQSVASRLHDERPDLADRLHRAVDAIDATIREIRTTIFALQAPALGATIRDDVVATCLEASRPLGFDPRVRFDGPVDAGISSEVTEHLLLVLREALSNVARHAKATSVEVSIEVGSDVVLRVEDDGVGPPVGERPQGYGLGNMADRATSLGGRVELRRGEAGGAVLEWRVPDRH